MEFKWSTIISQKVNIYVINVLERNVRFKVIVLQNIWEIIVSFQTHMT